METYDSIGAFRKRMGITKSLEEWEDRDFRLLLEVDPLAYCIPAITIWVAKQPDWRIDDLWRKYQLAAKIRMVIAHSWESRCMDSDVDRSVVANGLAELLTRQDSTWVSDALDITKMPRTVE